MFPLYDSIKAGRFPLINITLILITFYVFFRELLAPDPEAFITQYALIPSQLNVGNTHTLLPLVSAIFLHGGWLHILSNMWFLFVFGDNVEAAMGKAEYLMLYLVAGIIGNLVQYVFMPTSIIPLLGASGAVAGVLGAYFVLFPHAKVKSLLFIFILVTIVDIAAPIMLGFWFILQLFNGVTSLAQTSADLGGVAFWAHVGGFLSGMILAKLFVRRDYLDGNYVTR